VTWISKNEYYAGSSRNTNHHLHGQPCSSGPLEAKSLIHKSRQSGTHAMPCNSHLHSRAGKSNQSVAAYIRVVKYLLVTQGLCSELRQSNHCNVQRRFQKLALQNLFNTIVCFAAIQQSKCLGTGLLIQNMTAEKRKIHNSCQHLSA
jgi:hypothetical protein